MKSVTLLPNGVYCITDGRNALPDNSMTFGVDSEYYDADGEIAEPYRKLPKFTPKLLGRTLEPEANEQP